MSTFERFNEYERQYAEARFKRQAQLKADYFKKTQQIFVFPDKALSPFMMQLTSEATNNGPAKVAMIYATVIATVAAATQGNILIKGLKGNEHNFNITLTNLAPTGVGKSWTAFHFTEPLRVKESQTIAVHQEEMKKDEINKRILTIKSQALASKMKKLARNEEATDSVEQEIWENEEALAATIKQEGKIIFDQVTGKGAIYAMSRSSRGVFMINTEAAEFYKNTIAQNPEIFTRISDGQDYSGLTQDYGDLYIKRTNLVMLNYIQNQTMSKILAINSEKIIASGFNARTLYSISTPNEDGYDEYPDEQLDLYYQEYRSKIHAIFERFGDAKKDYLILSENAKCLLKNYIYSINDLLKSHPNRGDFFRRSEEHILKIAGSITLLEDPKAIEIPEEIISTAYQAFLYHLEMAEIIIDHEEIYNAKGIEEIAKDFQNQIESRCKTDSYAELSWLRVRVPMERRPVKAFYPVINYLIETNCIVECSGSKGKGYRITYPLPY